MADTVVDPVSARAQLTWRRFQLCPAELLPYTAHAMGRQISQANVKGCSVILLQVGIHANQQRRCAINWLGKICGCAAQLELAAGVRGVSGGAGK